MTQRWLALLLLVAVLGLSACAPQDSYSGRVVLDGDQVVRSGETLDGDLVILGGRAALEPGSRVTGSVYLLMGRLAAGGEIGGSVSLFGGDLALGPTATVRGDLKVGGGMLDRSPQAVVVGTVDVTPIQVPLSPGWWSERSLPAQAAWFAGRLLIIVGFAFVAAWLAPRVLARVAAAAAEQPVVSGALGTLSLVMIPALLVTMAFTFVLIPLVLVAVILGGLVVALGWVAVGLALGRRIAARLGRASAVTTQAALGTLVITVITEAVGVVPYLGEVTTILVAAVGLGALLLTRFGLRVFVPATRAQARRELA